MTDVLRKYRPYEQFTWNGVGLTLWVTRNASNWLFGDLPVMNREHSYYVITGNSGGSILGEGRFYEEVIEDYERKNNDSRTRT